MSLFLLLNTKEDILKNVGNKKVDGSHLLPVGVKQLLWKSMATVIIITVWLPTFKISSFVFNRRNILVQVWNNFRVSK